MTNDQVELKLAELVREERRITAEVLKYILLCEDRKIYLHRGFGSLFEYLVKKFGYSESAAYRRIQAARLARFVPDAVKKIESGEVNLTNMAKAQSMIRAEEKKSKVSVEQKVLALEAIAGQNTKEAEKTLLGLFPQAEAEVKTKVRAKDTENSVLTVTLSNDTVGDLRKVVEHLSHVHPDMDLAKVIATLAEEFLKKQCDTAEKNSCVKKSRSRAVPKAIRRVVMERAQRRCEYRDPKTGRQCGSTYQVEIDHIHPWSLGGTHDPTNLRCLCRAHNSLMSEKILGKAKANAWRASERPTPKR